MNKTIGAVLAGLSRIRVLNLREIRTHRLRVVTSLSVVVVASALLVAVLSTYGSLTESVRQVNAAITGAAQVEVAGISDSGVDEALAGQIRGNVPAAESVVPLIRDSVVLDGRKTALLGSDFRVAGLSGQLRAAVSEQGTGRSPADLADGLIVGAATGLREGQRLRVNGVDVRVVSVVDDEQSRVLNEGNFVFAYQQLAQRLTGKQGRVDSILIVARPGADLGALRSAVAREVDGRAVVVNPDFRAKQAEVAAGITRDATLLVAAISLVIAAFLVFNTMNMAVASRRGALAMMRALGARRIHLVGDLLGEAALFGLAGGIIGVPVGVLAGRWAVGRVPEASSESMTTMVAYHLPGYVPFVAVVACVLACVGATALAARSVFAVSPVEALTASEVADDSPARRRLSWAAGILGVVLVVASWFVATRVPGRPAILGGVVYTVGALLVCFALAGLLGRAIAWVSGRFGGPGTLAAVNVERAPRRAWATLMTVAIAVAVGMGTSGALDNMVASVGSSLDGLGDPDFYVSTTGSDEIPRGAPLPAEIESQARALPGVATALGAQWASVNVGDARILLQGLTPGSSAPFMKKTRPEALRQVLAGDGIVLSRVLARTLGLGTGDTLTLATPSGYRDVEVRDTVDYIAIDSGTAAISNTLLSQWFDRTGDTYLQVFLAPDADREHVRAALERIAANSPTVRGLPVQVYSGADALAATQRQVQQAGAFTVAIQWIVAGAAALALLNTLLLSVIERRRELGVLRAMGASRRFIASMVVAEAGAIAVIGSATGVIVGGGLHAVSDKILAATTSIDIVYAPRPSVLLFVAIAAGLCVVGALVPAVRASRMNITEAISTE